MAVGIERLSSMNRTSVAAGPRMGSAPAGAAAGWPLPSRAASTSALVTRPRAPLPLSLSMSSPWSAAIRAATGVALPSPFPVGAGVSAAGLAAVASAGGLTVPPGAPSPASMRHTTVPTATVSSGSTSSSVTVPATGDGSSASTLSVETSTSGSSLATVSPGFTSHSRIVPSATESPISGMATSTISPAPSPRLRCLALGLGLGFRRCLPGLDLAQDLADGHGLVGLGEDLGEHAGGGREHLAVDLVGGDLHHGVALGDRVADLLEPLQHRSFGDRLAHGGHHYLDGGALSRHLGPAMDSTGPLAPGG